MSSDPMGEQPGRVLLNGNAETVERFVQLAHSSLGPPRHRDPFVRERDTVVVCTGAWGPGELGDAPLRQAIADTGRGNGVNVVNLELYTSVRRYLAERQVVSALYDEHEDVWQELVRSYGAENDQTVARLRDAWDQARARDIAPVSLLAVGGRLSPGPPTRPTSHFLRSAYGGQAERAVHALIEADDRHAADLRELWSHFQLAAGLVFDPLWIELRNRLVERILGATALLLAGGSPSLLLVGFRFFQLEDVLAEALRRGTSYFGTSAGAMVLGRRVVVFNDRGVPRQEFQLQENGVGLVEGLQVFPHCTDRVQVDDPANLSYLAARFDHRTCVGLNQGSILQLEPEDGTWQACSVGDEDIVVFGRDGQKRRIAPGQAL